MVRADLFPLPELKSFFGVETIVEDHPICIQALAAALGLWAVTVN